MYEKERFYPNLEIRSVYFTEKIPCIMSPWPG